MSEGEPVALVARSAAGALFLDGVGRVLIVEPTYKPNWEIPGGMLEVGETPSQACVREVAEELGLTLVPGRLLVVDWAPHPVFGDRVLFVFDGGTLDSAQLAAIVLQAEELASYALVEPGAVGTRLIPRLARRVSAALEAREDGTTRYLEHGRPVG
ncbi:NUDIX domain-containing protein [Actinophytocola xanthii]|uniref:NUDIX hydrolase n=1 Tax=Actinophytocola xanthii TaxID=1912961 RepID=A0A1Q8CQD6_9PSEU|nr:NUDIX hydrolase [Actinophytocola xanthii]OLF16572.1 NUDIX hydrolase [Actinophytocola xanthii]